MKLHQLRAFIATLDAGSFSEAGLELGVSQASVSAAVAALERSLGVRLLDRGRFGAEPTGAGRRLADNARAMLRHERALLQDAALELGVLTGVLRVATYPSAARAVLPQLMTVMKQTYPELTVRLEVIDDNLGLETALRSHRAEVALQLNHHADDLLGWKVFFDPYQALLAPAHFPPPREVVGAEELARWPLILHRDNGCEPHLDTYLEGLGIEGEPVQRLNDTRVQLELVARGLGVAFITPMSVESLPEGVVALPLATPIDRTFLATLLPASLKIPAVRAFLGALRDRFPESDIPPLEVSGVGVSGTGLSGSEVP